MSKERWDYQEPVGQEGIGVPMIGIVGVTIVGLIILIGGALLLCAY